MDQLLELLKAVILQDGGEPVDLSQNTTIRSALSAAIAQGAKTEKDKVMPDLTRLKTELGAATEELKILRAQKPSDVNAALDEIRAALKQTTPAATTDPTIKPLTKEDVAALLASAVNDVIPKLMQPIEAKLAGLEKESVESYRLRRIKELGDAIIPEVVSGDTIEAVEASITLAKDLAAKYLSQTPPPVAPVAPPPVAPPALPTPPPGDPLVDQVKNLNKAQYAQQREGLFDQLKALVPG